jgi:redox-sensitive bicupin YhaK (pirin superfamily)
VEHRDSSGAGGKIGPGDVQWMTAAAGIVHEEFHGADYARTGGPFEMIQLWVNLPKSDKMAKPGYQEIQKRQIPELELADGGGKLRVIAGEFRGTRGPARTFTPMNLWDFHLNSGKRLELEVPAGHTAMVFVMKGSIQLPDRERVGEAELAVLEREGSAFAIETLEDTHLLFLGGQPLGEPVVGYGPFVMNTQEEIRQAFSDYQNGRMGHIART